MRSNFIINKLNLTDSRIISRLNFILGDFENSLGEENLGAMAYVAERIYTRKESNTIGFTIPPQDIDFLFGQPVYTGTPRLLLKVPKLYSREKPIIQDPSDDVKLGYGDSPLSKKSVLIYPNREGPQENVEDRPIVHWSGVCPGDYVIVGGVNFEDERLIHEIILNELKVPPSRKDIWYLYRDIATVTNLSNILISFRKCGFSNQYSTNEKYLDSAEPVTKNSIKGYGGLFLRNRDKERCVSVYIPGSNRIGYHPSEEMTGGGFVVLVKNKFGEESIRPISVSFMEKNYRYINNNENVVPLKNELTFIPRHVLANYEHEFCSLLEDIEMLNEMIREIYKD